MPVTIQLKYHSISKFLDAKKRAAINLKPAMDIIGAHMLSSVELNFTAQGRVDEGTERWKRLAKSTIRRRPLAQRAFPKILQQTGRLKNSIRFYSTKDSVRIGTNVAYGQYHQQTGKFGTSLINGNWRLVSRPFLRFHKQDLKFATETIRKYIARARR